MALVGYMPAPSGGYVFERDDGQKLHAFGEEAEQLKSFIDRTRPPDRRTASYDASAPFGSAASVPDVGPNMSAAPPPEQRASMSAPAALPPHGPGGAYIPETQPVAAPRAQPVAYREDAGSAAGFSPPGSPAAGVGPTITGPEVGAYALSPVYQPGSRGVSSQDIERQAAAKRATPVAQTIGGALVETPEEKADRIREMQAFREQRRAGFAEMEAAGAEKVAAAEQARTNALNASIQADIDRRDALALKARVDEEWNRTNAALNKEREAAANARIDPHRLFREKGTGSVIASAIAQGLGAFGASLTGGQNYAKQIIDAAIDRDIAAQSDTINANRERTQNAVNEFQRVYGFDREEAKLAVKGAAQRYAASLADITAATIGTAEAKMQAAQMKDQWNKEALMTDAQLSELYNGRKTTQYAMASPQAATAGGFRAPTAKEIKERAEALGAVNKASGGAEPEQRNADLKRQTFDLERRVTLPDGNFAYATTKERATAAQLAMDAGLEYKKNVARQREILNMVGDSVDPKLRGDYDTLAARNTFLQKQIEDLGAITTADQSMTKPMTGEGGQGLTKFKDYVIAQSESAEQHVDFRLRSAKKQLFQEPEAQSLVEPTEESLGIKETRQ